MCIKGLPSQMYEVRSPCRGLTTKLRESKGMEQSRDVPESYLSPFSKRVIFINITYKTPSQGSK
jgi:hypothetical protein